MSEEQRLMFEAFDKMRLTEHAGDSSSLIAIFRDAQEIILGGTLSVLFLKNRTSYYVLITMILTFICSHIDITIR